MKICFNFNFFTALAVWLTFTLAVLAESSSKSDSRSTVRGRSNSKNRSMSKYRHSDSRKRFGSDHSESFSGKTRSRLTGQQTVSPKTKSNDTASNVVIAENDQETEYTSSANFTVKLDAKKPQGRSFNFRMGDQRGRGGSHFSHSVYRGGCKTKYGELIRVNEIYTDPESCTELICKRTSYWYHLELHRGACGRHNGRCHYEDKMQKEGCITYKCYVDVLHDGRISTARRSVSGGCRATFARGCVPENKKKRDGCTEYTCTSEQLDDGRKSYQMKVSRPSCGRYNGKCFYEDDQYKDGCETSKCVIEAKRDVYYGTFEPVSGGCRNHFDSQCIDPGTIIEKDCKEYRCTATRYGIHTRYTFGVFRYSCGRLNGKCMYENDSARVGCKRYTCRSSLWRGRYYEKRNVC